MNFFNLFVRKDINEGIERYLKEENAVLLDVRKNEEYADGHIEGSINLPIGEIDRAGTVIAEKDVPVYVYCRSGKRSERAAAYLKGNGYTKVTDIGGILSYNGTLVN